MKSELNYQVVLYSIRKELKDYIIGHELKSLVLGISGGIDSALVAAIAKPVCDELNIPLIGRSISIGTNKEDEISRSKMIGQSFCTDFKEVDLSEEFKVLSNIDDDYCKSGFTNDNDFSYKIRMGNIKARMRMIYLYNLASKQYGIVLGTENKCEENIGFFTIGGDEISDFEPIKELWKTEVYELSEWMVNHDLKTYNDKIALTSCIQAVATDGLGITNSDLEQILPNFKGSSREGYGIVDDILNDYINNGKGDINNPVIQRHIKSDFKRKRPFVVKLKIKFNI